MSTNIQHVDYIGDLTIDEINLQKFLDKYDKDLPKSSVCEYVVCGGKIAYTCLSLEDGVYRIHDLQWSGSGSGYSYKVLLEFLKLTKGTASIILTWEGNPPEGLKVHDGKVSKAKVKVSLE